MGYVIDIPQDELKQFEGFIRIYSKGKVIIQEGDASDNRIFLLRQGEVEVLKQVDEQQQSLAKITAVNFFGEMSAITHRARTASIVALTEPVVVYAFKKLNVSVILKDPRWSLMLIKRLIDNLEKMDDEYQQSKMQINRMQTTIGKILGVFLTLHKAGEHDESVKPLVADAIPKIIESHLHETDIELIIPEHYLLDKYRQKGAIQDELFTAVITSQLSQKKQRKE